MQTKPPSEQYRDLIEHKRATFGDRFDPSDLDPRFAPYFRTGQRIRVEAYGETHFGTVGVTTGWKPAFLLMANRRCIGSSLVLGPNWKLTGVKTGRYYAAVSE